MSNAPLPERASLEYLKKLAKDRLHTLGRADPRAKLATALLDVARDHGFSSWRALKAHIEERRHATVAQFIEACGKEDTDALRLQIATDVGLVRARDSHGSTGLHAAAARGHAGAVQLLLRHDADPNARDAGDNACPLHFGMVSFGNAELMLNVHGRPGPHDVSLWFYTDQVDAFYDVLKSRRLQAAHAELVEAGGDPPPGIEFEQDIEDMFYGARQFCIRDLNGYELYFIGDRRSHE